MARHVIDLTDDDEFTFAAYVAWVQQQASTPQMPPVTYVESVDALIDNYMEPPRRSMRQWLKDHPEARELLRETPGATHDAR